MKKIINGVIVSIGLLILLFGNTELNSQNYPGLSDEDSQYISDPCVIGVDEQGTPLPYFDQHHADSDPLLKWTTIEVDGCIMKVYYHAFWWSAVPNGGNPGYDPYISFAMIQYLNDCDPKPSQLDIINEAYKQALIDHNKFFNVWDLVTGQGQRPVADIVPRIWTPSRCVDADTGLECDSGIRCCQWDAEEMLFDSVNNPLGANFTTPLVTIPSCDTLTNPDCIADCIRIPEAPSDTTCVPECELDMGDWELRRESIVFDYIDCVKWTGVPCEFEFTMMYREGYCNGEYTQDLKIVDIRQTPGSNCDTCLFDVPNQIEGQIRAKVLENGLNTGTINAPNASSPQSTLRMFTVSCMMDIWNIQDSTKQAKMVHLRDSLGYSYLPCGKEFCCETEFHLNYDPVSKTYDYVEYSQANYLNQCDSICSALCGEYMYKIGVNLNEEDNNSDFELYPNPTANVINLKSSLKYEGYDRFVVVSYEGLHIMTKIVNDISAETEYTFDMSNIPIGKYYIIAEGKFGQMQIGSFVKE